MKKVISMLLVTAFMLITFSALGAPAYAIGNNLFVISPYWETNIDASGIEEYYFTVESDGWYIIQTFGFYTDDDVEYPVGGNGTNLSMTLEYNDSRPSITVTNGSGYSEACFMYVELSSTEQYTLRIEGDQSVARLSFTCTTGQFEDDLPPSDYLSIRQYDAIESNPPTFHFTYVNEYEAQVCLVIGDGYDYNSFVMGSGYDKALIIDPRVELHYDGMEPYPGIYDVDDLAENAIHLANGIPYYLVVFFELGYPYDDYIGVDSIDVVVHFVRAD